MKKKLTLWIFFFPIVVMSQVSYKNGAISFDFGHKKQQNQDSVQQTQYGSDTLKHASHVQKQPRIPATSPESPYYDWRKDGIFKGLIHAGINASQVDADMDDGFNHPGFEGGVGVMVRWHRNFSASMEINYTMKGAKQNFVFNDSAATSQTPTPSLQLYRLSLDYIELPFAINVYDNRQIVMASAGLSIAALVHYYEQDQAGYNITGSTGGPGEPHKYDFCGFLGLHFIIAKHYAIGGQFSDALVPFRKFGTQGTSLLATGQFNSALTVEFLYILDTVKKKKKG